MWLVNDNLDSRQIRDSYGETVTRYIGKEINKAGCAGSLAVHADRENARVIGGRITCRITHINFRTDRYDTR